MFGLCFNCYGPIEAEKLEVIPEAQYCVLCARKLMSGPKNNKVGVVQYCPPICSATFLAPREKSSTYNTVVKKQPKRPSVLREEVTDGGVFNRQFMNRSRRCKSSTKLYYENGTSEVIKGDAVYTESLDVDKTDKDEVWIVNDMDVPSGIIYCHCSGDEIHIKSFFVSQVDLLYREIEVNGN